MGTVKHLKTRKCEQIEKFTEASDLLTSVVFFFTDITVMLLFKVIEMIFAHLCSKIFHQETKEVIDDACLTICTFGFIIIIIPTRFASLEDITDIGP